MISVVLLGFSYFFRCFPRSSRLLKFTEYLSLLYLFSSISLPRLSAERIFCPEHASDSIDEGEPYLPRFLSDWSSWNNYSKVIERFNELYNVILIKDSVGTSKDFLQGCSGILWFHKVT